VPAWALIVMGVCIVALCAWIGSVSERVDKLEKQNEMERNMSWGFDREKSHERTRS